MLSVSTLSRSLSFIHYATPPLSLHSFPTRRSSDLGPAPPAGGPPRRGTSRTTPPAAGPAARSPRSPGPPSRSPGRGRARARSEEHTSELQSQFHLVCRLLLEKKKKKKRHGTQVQYH